jgi:hypothetical protein
MAKQPSSTPPVVAYEISDRVTLQASARPYERGPREPVGRPLRIFTLDPSVSDRLGGTATVVVPYEKLEPGPVGALFAIVADTAPPPLKTEPLNLDDPHLLLSAGLSPTPSDGRFHLQMAYAVCSLTYAVFRRALGRDVAWATTPAEGQPHRLVVRPFAFRGTNAGYSREAGDLSFGYFAAGKEPAGFSVRKGLVCTALSHDIIAHETTHALLDALRSSFLHPTNVDVPAFHEGLADLVALFLHFTYTEVVERAIRDARGNPESWSLLADLAREFGFARGQSGRGSALRSGVDVQGLAAFDSDAVPSREGGPLKYDPALEAHALGTVLVSAVFEAFTTIVKRKVERYFRIAGLELRDFGRVPLSEPLVKAIAQEASDVAAQFLNICIRAIDYCPPADIELGEYLRALITADADMEAADKWGFREALMRSFRRRQIFPDHVQFMTEDAVRWQGPDTTLRVPGLAFSDLRFNGEPGQPASVKELLRQAHALGKFVTQPANARALRLIAPGASRSRTIVQASPVLVQSVRVARRARPDGRVLFDIVAEVTQSCTVKRGGDLFDVTGGCTLVIDPRGEVRYAIYKRFDSDDRLERQQAAMRGPLKKYWKKRGRQYQLQPDVLQRVHNALDI